MRKQMIGINSGKHPMMYRKLEFNNSLFRKGRKTFNIYKPRKNE